MKAKSNGLAALPDEALYPSSDGEPLGETGIHVLCLHSLFGVLHDHFQAAGNVLVTCDQFWYYEEGNPKANCAPDIMIVKGVDPSPRRSFFSWLEVNPTPNVVFEIVSENKWRKDVTEKKALYQSLDVAEYFLFDPEAMYLQPPLRGFRLRKGVYVPVKPDGEGRLRSKQLGMFLVGQGGYLRLVDAATGEDILTSSERAERLDEVAQRAIEEARRANEMIARLQAENERLKKKVGDA